jgi:hypothetical protein
VAGLLSQGAGSFFRRPHQDPGLDQRFRRFEVRGHEGVGVDERHLFPDALKDGAGDPAGREGPAQVEALGRAGGLHG